MDGIEDLAMGILKTGKLSVQGDPGGAIITIIIIYKLPPLLQFSNVCTVLDFSFYIYFLVLAYWCVVSRFIVVLTLTHTSQKYFACKNLQNDNYNIISNTA